jgi:hypothetical protein
MTSTWTETDFDSLCWHDTHVHGLRFVDDEHGSGELWLDLDLILEWIGPAQEGGSFRFRVAPALLKFHEVLSLRVSLDYATPGAGTDPFSIDGIEREAIARPEGFHYWKWRLEVNWPQGEITFGSPGFTLQLTGPVVETGAQQLTPAERKGDFPAN